MAWETLKTDYTDAIWTGNRKYKQILNDDETVSFEDVTEYSQKENSFFGANDANSINEAVNYIMKALENDTDLYEDFKTYFDNQKTAFTTTGDNMMNDLQEGYQTAMENYRETQDANFTAWVETLKAKLDDADVAKLQGEIEDLTESSKVTLSDSGSTTDYAKIYTISQGNVEVGKINIPKDLVVESGSVVNNPTSELTGTYIKLVIANQTEPIYINVADLCDAYTGGSTSTVNVSISDTNEVTATIVSGSINKSLLSSDVQTTLNQVTTNALNITSNSSEISKITNGSMPVTYYTSSTSFKSGDSLSSIIGSLGNIVGGLDTKIKFKRLSGGATPTITLSYFMGEASWKRAGAILFGSNNPKSILYFVTARMNADGTDIETWEAVKIGGSTTLTWEKGLLSSIQVGVSGGLLAYAQIGVIYFGFETVSI